MGMWRRGTRPLVKWYMKLRGVSVMKHVVCAGGAAMRGDLVALTNTGTMARIFIAWL